MRQGIRDLALKLPQLRRLLEHRDELLRRVSLLSAELEAARADAGAARADAGAARSEIENLRGLLNEQEEQIARLVQEMRKTEPDLGDPSTRIALLQIGKTGGTTLDTSPDGGVPAERANEQSDRPQA